MPLAVTAFLPGARRCAGRATSGGRVGGSGAGCNRIREGDQVDDEVAGEVRDTAVAARDAWEEYLERAGDLKRAMRRSGRASIQWELQRVEAYDALVGRDEGMGMSMGEWLDRIEQVCHDADPGDDEGGP